MSTFTPFLWLNGLARERDWLRERRDALCPLLPTALLTAGLALVFAHYLFLVTGYTGPDGLCEGLLWATNLSWNVRLGRWLMAWTRQASLSIVMPALFFAANTLGIALASLLLADLWQLRSRWFVAWTCIAFAVAPALVWQALVVHLTLSFALSMLLAVATVWLAFCQPSPFRFVLAVICMAFSMGGYQAYVGIAAGLTLLSVMLACNVIDVIAPDVQVDRLMSYPLQFVLPFCLAVWALPAAPRVNRLTRAVGTVLTALVCWLFAISATATYRTVALSYEYVGTLTDSILNQVMADSDYTADNRLLMAGFPDETRVQDANALYWYSQYQRSPLFWGGTHGILDCWPTYLYDYHGFNAGGVTLAEYENIVSSAEFAAMPVYPQAGSITYFGDVLVVKLEENPPQ